MPIIVKHVPIPPPSPQKKIYKDFKEKMLNNFRNPPNDLLYLSNLFH